MKVVLLPGLHGGTTLFGPFVRELGSDLSPILVDLNADPALNYADLAESILPHLPKERFVLLAESFSGPAAIRLASFGAEKGKIAALILVATFDSRLFSLFSETPCDHVER